MPEVQKDFLARQHVQAPLIELDTSWLRVGHIDEFVNFAPDSSGNGWRLVVANTDLAFDSLADLDPEEPLFYCGPTTEVEFGEATGGSADTLVDAHAGVDFTACGWAYVRIYEGPGAGQIGEIESVTAHTITVARSWRFQRASQVYEAIVGNSAEFLDPGGWDLADIPQSGSKYVLLSCSKQWLDSDDPPQEFPAAITVGELRDESREFWAQNLAVQSRIDPEIVQLQNALQGAPYDLELVPAIYIDSPVGGEALAYVPGLVNFQVWNPYDADNDEVLPAQLWLPMPLGPRLNGMDVFEDSVRQSLSVPGGVYVIDNWDTYHRREGEVHCGTNVIRVPQESGPYDDWWNNLP